MPRPKFYRDPIHGQLRFDRVEQAEPPAAAAQPERALSWLIHRLVDSREFQRLRHIRQNGLVSTVFHGAEHSRFGHSLGCAYLAREMYYRIVRNMDEAVDGQWLVSTTIAALLHDLGHGPFSHVLEEILHTYGIKFDHEVLTYRFLTEEGSEVHRLLASFDASLPGELGLFINKKARAKLVRAQKRKDHWCYKLVSSQMDADRLDYLVRDAYYAGLEGHGFDLQRLLDMLLHLDHTRIAVYRRAIEPVEGYLLALDQMYRTVYYHHTARAASVMLSAALRRAFELHKNGDHAILPDGGSGRPHPLRALIEHGERVALDDYARLGEFHVFALLEDWQHSRDPVLADLSGRLLRRHLFKAIDVDPHKYNTLQRLQKRAEELALSHLPHVDRRTVQYYVAVDEPERLSYKLYDWRNERADESIWIVDGPPQDRQAAASASSPSPSSSPSGAISAGRSGATPIEKEPSSIITALQTKKYFHRLIVPAEIRAELIKELDD